MGIGIVSKKVKQRVKPYAEVASVRHHGGVSVVIQYYFFNSRGDPFTIGETKLGKYDGTLPNLSGKIRGGHTCHKTRC